MASALRFLLSVVGSLSFLGGTAAAGADLARYEQAQIHMAAVVKVVIYCESPQAATAAFQAAFDRVEVLNNILSDYVDDSELNRFCRTGVQTKVALSSELFFVLERSQFWNRESDGAFDATAGPIIRLWRQARRTKRLPSAKQIEEAKKLVGGGKLQLDDEKVAAQLAVPGMRLDLGGIAKGYIGDDVLRTLANLGIKRAMIVLGGDVVCGDAPPNERGWKIAIADLAKPGEFAKSLPGELVLVNRAVSTSGDAAQFTEIAGKRYSHIVDPRTGHAQTGRRQTTVVAATGVDADALDTAAIVLGVEKGSELIEKHGAAGVFLVVDEMSERKEVRTKGWANLQMGK